MGDRYRYSRPRSPTLYNPARASLPVDVGYPEYSTSPVRDHHMHVVPTGRREVIANPRSSTSSIGANGPVTTTTYKIKADPVTRASSVRESSRARRSTLDSTPRPPVPTIVTTGHPHRHRDRPVVHVGSARPSSPLRDPYRSSQEDYYAIPASSKHGHHHHKRYSATMDNADMNRLATERDSGHLHIAPREERRYTRTRPLYANPVVRDTADYGDDGYGYTTPRDLVQWDLNNTATAPRYHGRHSSYDWGRPSSITSYNDMLPPRSYDSRDRPPVSTRGFDRIPPIRNAPPPYEWERPEVRMPAPPPMDPIRPPRADIPQEIPRRSDSVSRRPVSLYHDRERRGSGRDDYYEVRDDEPRYRNERYRHDRHDDVVEQRGYGVRSERVEPVRSERHDRAELPKSEHRVEKDRHDDDHKDHKGREAAMTGLSLAGAALGVKAFKDTPDEHDDRDEPRRRRDYDEEPRRRRDPRDDRDAVDSSGRDPKERRRRDDSPSRESKERSAPPAPEIVDLSSRDPKERHGSRDERHASHHERHGSRDGRETDPESRRPLSETAANGTAIETEPSTASDEAQPRHSRQRRESGPGFNPRDTMDLKALKEALNKESPPPATQPAPTRTPRESISKDSRELTEVRSDLQSDSRIPRIVTPPPTTTETKAPVKGILRAPREKFPEDPAPIREGVAPLKDAKKDGVPPDARWTKISRKLVNPEALEAGKERYEAREDFVIVLRVLSRDEVQAYAEVTERIRGKPSSLSPYPLLSSLLLQS